VSIIVGLVLAKKGNGRITITFIYLMQLVSTK